MKEVIGFSNENLLAIDDCDPVHWMKNKGYVDVQKLNDNNFAQNDDLVHFPKIYGDGGNHLDLKICDDDNLFLDNHGDLFHDNLDMTMKICFVMMAIKFYNLDLKNDHIYPVVVVIYDDHIWRFLMIFPLAMENDMPMRNDDVMMNT